MGGGGAGGSEEGGGPFVEDAAAAARRRQVQDFAEIVLVRHQAFRSVVHSLARSLAHSTHALTQLTHSLTRLTHSLTHYLVRPSHDFPLAATKFGSWPRSRTW